MLHGDLRHRRQTFPGIHRAGGVVGVIQNDHFRFFRHRCLQRRRIDLEAVLFFQGQIHKHAATEFYQILVADKGRGEDNDLVSLVHKGQNGVVDGLGAAGSDEYLRLRIVGDAGLPGILL